MEIDSVCFFIFLAAVCIFLIVAENKNYKSARTTMKDIEFSHDFCNEHDGPRSIKRNKYGLQITCRDDFRVSNLRPFVEGR